MMPMYARGYVTYGTVVATLIATLGDSAFVLIGVAVTDSCSFITPLLAVHAISFFVGVTWGYLVDMAGITPRTPLGRFGPTIWQEEPQVEPEGESPLDDLSREVPEGLGYKIYIKAMFYGVDKLTYLVWFSLFCYWCGRAKDPDYNLELSTTPFTLDGFITWIGLIGTIFSVVLYVAQKNWFADDTEATIGDKLHSGRETMVHASAKTAFVTFWVMIAYLAFEFMLLFSGLSEQDMAKYGDGIVAVTVAYLAGVIPGCGPQNHSHYSVYEGDNFILALAANAISQDGDALFPLLVRHKARSLGQQSTPRFQQLLQESYLCQLV